MNQIEIGNPRPGACRPGGNESGIRRAASGVLHASKTTTAPVD